MKQHIASFALLTTWIMIFALLTFFTQLILVPWDTAITQPEVGTWQRTVNDFFATSPGYFIVSASLLFASILLSIRVVQHNRKHLLMLIAGNIVFAILLCGMFTVAAHINNTVLFPYPDVRYDPAYEGFHRSMFPGLCMLLVSGLWLYWQGRVSSSSQSV